MFGLDIKKLMNIDLGTVMNDLLISGALYLAKKHNIPLVDFQAVIKVHEVTGKNGAKKNITVIYASDNSKKVYEKMTTFELAKAIKGNKEDEGEDEKSKDVNEVQENEVEQKT